MARSELTMPDLMRGVAGATLLGAPLVYTQEIWSHGATMHPAVILAMLAATFVIVGALSRAVGFGGDGDSSSMLTDAVIALGSSIILSAALLWLLRRIGPSMPLHSAAGIVALTSLPVSIGFAIGNALAPKEGGKGASQMRGPAADLLVAAGGTIVFVLNIAPTEEPLLLASHLTLWHLLLVIAASLALSYLIVFYAEFNGKNQRRSSDGATQGPFTETLLAYLVSLAVCALLLLSFGRLHGATGVSISEVIVLAFPGTLGGALGRMLV